MSIHGIIFMLKSSKLNNIDLIFHIQKFKAMLQTDNFGQLNSFLNDYTQSDPIGQPLASQVCYRKV